MNAREKGSPVVRQPPQRRKLETLGAFFRTGGYYLCIAVFLTAGNVIFFPLLFLHPSAAFYAQRFGSGGVLFIMRWVLGMRCRLHGVDRFATGAPVIYASKHQSVWDSLFYVFSKPSLTAIYGDHLLKAWFFGPYLSRLNHIPVDRESISRREILEMKRRIERQREGQFLIFPQGTRIEPGRQGSYFSGVYLVYRTTGLPCVPVALNSGVAFPPRRLLKYPGAVDVSFLEPIPPGLPRADFMARLSSAIEAETQVLLRLSGDSSLSDRDAAVEPFSWFRALGGGYEAGRGRGAKEGTSSLEEISSPMGGV